MVWINRPWDQKSYRKSYSTHKLWKPVFQIFSKKMLNELLGGMVVLKQGYLNCCSVQLGCIFLCIEMTEESCIMNLFCKKGMKRLSSHSPRMTKTVWVSPFQRTERPCFSIPQPIFHIVHCSQTNLDNAEAFLQFLKLTKNQLCNFYIFSPLYFTWVRTFDVRRSKLL